MHNTSKFRKCVIAFLGLTQIYETEALAGFCACKNGSTTTRCVGEVENQSVCENTCGSLPGQSSYTLTCVMYASADGCFEQCANCSLGCAKVKNEKKRDSVRTKNLGSFTNRKMK